LEHPTPEAFGIAIRQSKQLTHGQQRFDGQVAENKRMPLTLFEVVVLSLFEDFLGKPKRDVAPINQRLVLLCPVSDFVGRACFRTHDWLRCKVGFDGFDKTEYTYYGKRLRLYRVFLIFSQQCQ
jgi:hypothetical protein